MQQLPTLDWKGGIISLDFITRLPKNQKQSDSIITVIDKLSKETHFIHVKTTYKDANIADIFIKDFFWLYRISKVIISYRDLNCTGM